MCTNILSLLTETHRITVTQATLQARLMLRVTYNYAQANLLIENTNLGAAALLVLETITKAGMDIRGYRNELASKVGEIRRTCFARAKKAMRRYRSPGVFEGGSSNPIRVSSNRKSHPYGHLYSKY